MNRAGCVGVGSTVNPLAPDTAQSMGRLTLNCLYIGPSVVVMGLQTLRKALRIARIRVKECSPVIASLLAADRRMSFPEIIEAVPGLEPVRVFPDLGLIDGVLFLQSDPPGLSLSGKLKKTLWRR